MRRRLSAEFEIQRHRASVAGCHEAPAESYRPALALVSPRLRPREFSEGSPEDRGLAAAARLAAAVTSATGSSTPSTDYGPGVHFRARPRRHSALAYPDTVVTSTMLPGTPPVAAASVTVPAVAASATAPAMVSPPPLRYAWKASSAVEERQPVSDQRRLRIGVGPSTSRVPPGEVAAVPLQQQPVPPQAQCRAEVHEPALRPRLQRAQSVVPPVRPAGPQRAKSADPRRRSNCIRSGGESESTQEDTKPTGRELHAEPDPALTRNPTSPVLTVAASGSEAQGARTARRSATAGGQLAAAAAMAASGRPSGGGALTARLDKQATPFKKLTSSLFSGEYSVGKFLGRGASASVWEALRSDNQERVAVKVFDQGQRDKRQAHREMKVLSRIQHPRIIEAYEVIETSRHAQLICELVDGESLRSYSHRQPDRKLPEPLARKLYRQVVEGVSYCHEKLVVHRDLKLENLLLDRSREHVKIIDFGFAAQVASRDTKLRAFCGTPSYMAPEIIRGDGYSGFAADVWALGVVVFALLAGTLPFAGRTEMQLYAKIRRGVFSTPEGFSDYQRRLVKGCLRTDFMARPSSAAILRHVWITGYESSDVSTEASTTTGGSESSSRSSRCSSKEQGSERVARDGALAADGELRRRPTTKVEPASARSPQIPRTARTSASGLRASARGYPKYSPAQHRPTQGNLTLKLAAGQGTTAFGGS
eukprot:TRINITY_DN92467_c0_g1_i1.p1 TRINITY_DN92467_c0_g1~~TRINITY_DN92467_c0_g1_i1.p1  ORF type:complete len:731 (+),score=97.66 TRINITY_DN92467_c0_g1_i1:73-2193(+)